MALWLGLVVLGIIGLVAVLSFPLSRTFFSSPTVSAVAGSVIETEVSTISHLGLPLLLSGLAVTLSIASYLRLDCLRAAMAGALKAFGFGLEQGFD